MASAIDINVGSKYSKAPSKEKVAVKNKIIYCNIWYKTAALAFFVDINT